MFNERHSKPQDRIGTLVRAETKIDGNPGFSGGLRVDGGIKGDHCHSEQAWGAGFKRPRSHNGKSK